MPGEILVQLRAALQELGISFREVQHAPASTSEESAKARGEDLKFGAKALLLRYDEQFGNFVLPADRQLDSVAVKRHLQVKRLRFATAEELRQLTGLVPGSLPPFGHPIFPYELFADDSLGVDTDRIAFNAGSLTVSIVMSAADWEGFAKPHRFAFTKTRD
ncbi:MAG TPA: YbaK/EbsC family protein [Lacipirellulaceae bacterium]|nr:YbaK/EbsC family protein [Lacipirellulaceae bacterium]